MNVKTFILKSGLEIVSKYNEPSKGVYELVEPFKVLYAPVQVSGPQGMTMVQMPSMAPLLATVVRSSYFLTKDELLFGPFEVSKEVEFGYLKQTTGIQLAS